ncbi:MAG: helix-turn-helix transcriptional regulator [Candidatus Zapsychrus exili]|nr:helix-turn-helix transcriptional regulator [Candidatus Zapsychrus exili]
MYKKTLELDYISLDKCNFSCILLSDMSDQFWKIYKECKAHTDELLEVAGKDKEKQRKTYARKIYDYRKAHDLTRDELAKKLKVSKMEILRWENAKHMPSELAIDKMKQVGIL